MAMNPMQKKARTSFLLGMFITLIITGIIITFLILQLSKIKEEQNSIQFQSVYVLTTDVISGDKLIGNLQIKEVETTYIPNNALVNANFATYITEDAIAKINLRKDTILTTDMIAPSGEQTTADVRLQEYNMVVLPSQLEVGEHVDIRLRLPSGEDFIVMSKKYIEQTNSNTIWIKVSEEEILTMSNAIVEAYIMEGSLLYATTYVDAGMQGASTPTYIASQTVINLINADPNITATAMNKLMQRYTENARNQRGSINSALGGYANEGLNNVETNLAEEIQKMQSARQEYVDGLSNF